MAGASRNVGGGEALGFAAAAAAVTIWAGWIVVTRFAVTEAVSSTLLALFRYGIPAVLLAPVWLRRGIVPRGMGREGLGALVLMTLGWGAPFVFWTAAGLETIPAALFAPLVPGLLPIAVALLGWALLGDRMAPRVRWGALLMGLSVALILGQWGAEGDLAALSGVPFLLMGMLGWAVYTLAFRRSGLTPIEATAYVGLYSMPIVAVAWALADAPFAGLSGGEIALHAIAQGLVSGIAAVLAYGVAIGRLGVSRASALIALVPVCTAVMGALILDERLTVLDWIAVAAASLGVAAAQGAFARRPPRRA